SRTAIPSLRVGYNRVFGYYIEVSRPHLAKVPGHYERRQTLTGAERFVTAELRAQEARVLGAEERLREAECEHFVRLREEVAGWIESLQKTAGALADLDALASLAETAERRGYVRPGIGGGDALELVAARDPEVQAVLPPGRFVPHHLRPDTAKRQIPPLTVPKMAGKT